MYNEYAKPEGPGWEAVPEPVRARIREHWEAMTEAVEDGLEKWETGDLVLFMRLNNKISVLPREFFISLQDAPPALQSIQGRLMRPASEATGCLGISFWLVLEIDAVTTATSAVALNDVDPSSLS